MKKFLVITLSLVVVIIIALTIFLKIYVTPEKIKEFLIPAAEEFLNRKVSIDEIGISLMKGISLKGFTIKEPDGKTDFISCKEFVLKFKLIPLLSRKVIIDELRLVSPAVRIERTKSGKFNFQDIGQKKTADLKEEKPADESGGLPVSLLVSNVSVKDASFSLIDQTKEIPDVKGSLSVEMTMKSDGDAGLLSKGNINLRLAEIVRSKPSKKIKDIDALLEYDAKVNPESGEILINKADLKVNGIPVSIKGTTKDLMTSPYIDLTVSLPNVNIKDLQILLASFVNFDGLELSGLVSTNLKVKGMPVNFESITTDGTLLLKNVDVKFNNINTSLDGNLKFSTESDNVSISKADLQINGLAATLKGKVQNFKTSPYLDISLSLPKSKASDLQKAVRSFASLEGLSLTGGLSADIKLKGKPEKLESMKANGNIKLDKVGVTYEDIKALFNGDIKFTDKLLSINLKSTIGRNTAELKGTVSSYFKNQKININLYSKKLFIDELIHAGKQKGTSSGKQAKSSKPASKRTAGEAKPLNLKMTASGEIRVDSAVYNGLTMSSFLMTYQFKNNKLNISKLNGKAGKGRFNLKSSLDLSKPGYKYNLSGNVDSLYAEEIINAFFPKAKDTVFGIIKADLKLNGAGTLTANIRKNLVADVNFDIQDGKVTNIGIADSLSMLFNLSELKTIKFHQANGTVMIRNGIAKLNSVFRSDDLEMNPGGDIGLDGNLDLAFDLKLSPRLTGKAVSSSISKYMTDQRGWGTIPLICPGTMSKPSCGPDLVKTGKKVIEKEIDKVLDRLFNKDQKEPPPEGEEQKPGLEEPLKELFKQLF